MTTHAPRRRAPADPALRLRLQRMLGAAQIEPEAMPPAAILVVRALGDPLPGRMRAEGRDAHASAEWARACRGALSGQLHGAARPSRGVLPADAPAVLFADQAELLAAFARDACAGVAGARWWWTTVARGLGGSIDAVVALWLRDPRHVPAAVEHLAGWGEAERVMAALAPAQAARILGAVAHAFELRGLFAPPPPSVADEGEAEDADSVHRPGDPSSPSAGAARSAPSASAADRGPAAGIAAPWEMVLGPALVPRSLAPERRALLGVSLALHRAPLIARGPAFVERFVRWRAETARPRPQPPRAPAPSSPTPDGRAPDARLAPPSSAAPPAAEPASSVPAAEVPDTRQGAGRFASPPAAEGSSRASDEGDARSASTETRPASPADPPADEPRQTTAEPTAEPPATSVEEIRRVAPVLRFTGAPIETAETMSAACGVFYLVNVVRSLGFFRALDEHFRLPSVVGGWGWIELLARALLGPRAAGLADDPVWRVLAGLDGREPEVPPGMGFVAPPAETLPDAWATILRDAGAESPAPSPPLGMEPSPELRRFLDQVVPFVRLRVESALRAGGADEGLESALFRRIGRIQATRAHVDVRMELDQVSLAVRIAGLDATPGWVPELARVVTFHFA
ncbi:MAG TPA: hypothetical protein VF584_20595 [Longimicrobium sp.]|jgi:hypothetical protein